DPINDRFGYPVYLREDNGVFYIIREFPIVEEISDQLSSFYGSTYIINNSNGLEESLNSIDNGGYDNILRKLEEIDENDENYIDKVNLIIEEQTINLQSLILENIFIRYVINGERSR